MIKKISAKEFREEGYLQELNRQFLHPLGLALEVIVNDDGTEVFGQVWDSRDDPEGIIFGDDLIDRDKVQKIFDESVAKAASRKEALGFVIQPD
jgi:hypothetical protein